MLIPRGYQTRLDSITNRYYFGTEMPKRNLSRREVVPSSDAFEQ
jgi:hypothetical protein